MSRRTRWIVALLVVLLAGGAVVRTLMARKAATAASAAVAPKALALELSPSDIATAATTEMTTLLELTGSLKAVNSAVLKAKVATEVREILVREGDSVKAGQLVGRLDDTEFRWRLRQAQDQAAAAQAQLDIAARQLANNQALVNQGFISQTALETSASNRAGAQASLEAARAAAEIAAKAVRDTELRSPIAGVVSARLVQPGERVGLDARLLEIVDLSRLEFEAAVTPEDVVSLRVGQTARVLVDGLTQPVSGQVSRINPSTQAGTRAVMAYLAVDGLPGLRQGLFGRGSIELQRRKVLAVPATAVRFDQSRPYVLVVTDGQARQRPVVLGARGDVATIRGREAGVEVTTGLAEGDMVLRGSVGSLRDGTAVKLPAAGAAAPVAAGAAAASGAALPSAPSASR